MVDTMQAARYLGQCFFPVFLSPANPPKVLYRIVRVPVVPRPVSWYGTGTWARYLTWAVAGVL